MTATSLHPAALLDGLVIRVDHVGICVSDIDEAGQPWTQLLGCEVVDREEIASQQVAVGWLRLPGEQTKIELISSLGNAGLDKFLAKRGNAMHHVAISVTDIREAVRRMKTAGLRLIDQEPRPGAGGHLVAFLHPSAMAGTLVELVQAG
ncbi:MAG: methylmalonyl-CoA epimerase [Proteobacteria bacterium]|nr:methylmalonyl-CoA epimerase [Pseudomonadota bacterium]